MSDINALCLLQFQTDYSAGNMLFCKRLIYKLYARENGFFWAKIKCAFWNGQIHEAGLSQQERMGIEVNTEGRDGNSFISSILPIEESTKVSTLCLFMWYLEHGEQYIIRRWGRRANSSLFHLVMAQELVWTPLLWRLQLRKETTASSEEWVKDVNWSWSICKQD